LAGICADIAEIVALALDNTVVADVPAPPCFRTSHRSGHSAMCRATATIAPAHTFLPNRSPPEHTHTLRRAVPFCPGEEITHSIQLITNLVESHPTVRHTDPPAGSEQDCPGRHRRRLRGTIVHRVELTADAHSPA